MYLVFPQSGGIRGRPPEDLKNKTSQMKFEDTKGVIHKLKYTTIRKHDVFWKMV